MPPAWYFARYALGLARAQTQTSTAEQMALSRYAEGRHHCVEIGIWHGVNTLRIREAMAEDGVLTGVDPFAPGRLGVSFPHLISKREIARSSRGSFVLLRMSSADALRVWRDPIDFVFIDGDHSYQGLATDWKGWSPFVVATGIVCLHDSHPTPSRPIASAGSVRFTQEVIRHDDRFETVEVVETLTVLRRRPA